LGTKGPFEMLLAILLFLVGMALGQRFTVLVLALAIAPAVVIVVGIGVAGGQTPGMITLLTVAGVVSLQIGYLLGLGVRQLTAAGRASRQPSGSFADSSSARRTAH
jgi:hypothetical protein